MAKFRNVFKRRSRETGVKKRYLQDELQRVLRSVLANKNIQSVKCLDISHGTVEEILFIETEPKSVSMAVVASENRSGQPIKEETWAEYFSFRFYRLWWWFAQLWAAAGFQKVGAWMPDYLRYTK